MKSSGNIKAESKMKQTLVENRGVTNNICIHEMIPKNIDFGVVSRLRVGSLLRTWADVSRINYMSLEPLDIITSGQSIRRRSIGLSGKKYSIHCFVPSELRNKSEEDLFAEQFPVNVTSLMNEDQLWGFFYIFPELYADIYSPIICVRNIEDVPELVGGILTRAMVTACLSYLSRTPILQDFVYIKLDLSTKHLTNIDVLQHYKYLVYLDISSNLLTEISVLSYLPYLQFLSVAFNRLNTVLEYDTHAEEVDPITQRTYKMDMTPNVNTFATRRLLRLLYVEQLSRALVSPYTPPADTTEVPIVVLVGYEAVGKGKLARRLVNKCSKNVEMSYQHTTAPFHFPGHYKEVSRSKFDDMLLHGDLLTYAEMAGESYGLSRQESFTKNSKVKIATMDLLGALMLKLRGRRPFLILATCRDKIDLQRRQHERKILRDLANEQRMSVETPLERSTLQVLLSGRIIITGILNEIFMSLPEQKEQSEFVIESECSLMMNSEVRQAVREYIREVNLLTLLASSTTSLEEGCNREHDKNSQLDPSLYSLYKESQGTDEYYYSYVNGQNSHQERNQQKKANEIRQSRTKQEKQSNISRPKSVDFSRYASSTWKGLSAVPDSAKSSKSVTFTSQDNNETQNQEQVGPLGMLIEPKKSEKEVDKSKVPRSISTKIPWPTRGQSKIGSGGSLDDLDLWLAFLAETGLMQASSSNYNTWDTTAPIHQDTRIDDPKILKEFDFYNKEQNESSTSTIRDDYETVHQNCPGLFWDTVLMDDPDEAFHKVKKIIHDIVDSQPQFKPMFDIDFANLNCYNSVKKKLANIINQIAPQSK
ncbi:uncharacterized protein LOC131847195 isoform X6 [Achroia grisella]|uniref:uncharacterized protein LOC131847195 isoform X6 n=1 Tax=Achroia grisella TaxID=688607 RepID=UPI0027D322CB|nr:uncharacterized protein LOC131847195 isoform X6 [Achroia grisella]